MASRKAQMDEAAREAARYGQLSEISVSNEIQEQRQTNADSTAAAYRQAVADRAATELNLRRSVVLSPVDGTVTNVLLEPGDYVTTGKGVMALVERMAQRVPVRVKPDVVPQGVELVVGRTATVTVEPGNQGR